MAIARATLFRTVATIHIIPRRKHTFEMLTVSLPISGELTSVWRGHIQSRSSHSSSSTLDINHATINLMEKHGFTQLEKLFRQLVKSKAKRCFRNKHLNDGFFNETSGMTVSQVGRASREPPVPKGEQNPNASFSVRC